MPTLHWRSLRQPDNSADSATVMASRFRLRRLRDVPRFFTDAIRIQRQVIRADGALGVSLVAHPLRREFLTLSAWSNHEALDALVRTDPHRSAMRRHRPAMAESTFRLWDVPHAELPIGWDEARRRLNARDVSSN